MHIERLAEEAHRRQLKIAIDGPAGAGKSTVGKGVAEALGCAYLDTGLMYRAVTWLALQADVPLGDGNALGDIARETPFATIAGDHGAVLAADVRLARELRSPLVEAAVSTVSAVAEVREALVRQQRRFANGRCAVLVGRDIGTTVLPEADVKLWVTASAAERARRRSSEPDAHIDLAATEAAIAARDKLDTSRAVSPLRCAADATVVDSDGMDAAATVQAALHEIERALLTPARAPQSPRS